MWGKPHWDEHSRLSSVNEYDVRLKLLRVQVYQFKLQCMIITLQHAAWDSWMSKSCNYLKERNNARESSLPLCFRIEKSQCVCAEAVGSTRFQRFTGMRLLCPSIDDLPGFILTSTLTSLFCPQFQNTTLVTHCLQKICHWLSASHSALGLLHG